MKKSIFVVSCLAVTLAVAPACATKKFVRTEVGQVNDKVTTLGTSLEETQERVRAAEQKIGEVDTKAVQAGQAAQTADKNAMTAQQTGNQAMEVGKQAVGQGRGRRSVGQEAHLRDRADRRPGQVPQRRSRRCSDEAKAALDQMVAQVKSQTAAIWVEIEGHTDNTGDAAYNERLGLERAEAVKRYLYEQHQVPLHKMNAISFGEEKPVQDNKTRDNRSQNRRVVIKVLA